MLNQSSSRAIVKNIIVAVTLGVAAVATWAVTWSETPRIEVASSQASNG